MPSGYAVLFTSFFSQFWSLIIGISTPVLYRTIRCKIVICTNRYTRDGWCKWTGWTVTQGASRWQKQIPKCNVGLELCPLVWYFNFQLQRRNILVFLLQVPIPRQWPGISKFATIEIRVIVCAQQAQIKSGKMFLVVVEFTPASMFHRNNR